MEEQFSRIKKMIGNEKLNGLKNSKILLVGIGGVGEMAFEMLVRCGIKNITIIDYDVFEESNLNRQIFSLNSNINKSKVIIAHKRALDINKEVNITSINKKLDDELIKKLDVNYDFIIDACDDVKAKVLLVKYALSNDIKIISCCGTGNRLDPTKLCITNIFDTKYDPLAKKLRYCLRKEKINYKLPVVYSKEEPLIKTSGFVSSMAMVPNYAGILLASYVINNIIDK